MTGSSDGTTAMYGAGVLHEGSAVLENTRSLQNISSEWIKVAKRFRPDPERTRSYRRLAEVFEKYIETNANLHQSLSAYKR